MLKQLKTLTLTSLLMLSTTNVFASNCATGNIGWYAIEPGAGYVSAEFAGTVRFVFSPTDGAATTYSYISPSQQNFSALYSTLTTAKVANLEVELCWDTNAEINGYYRMSRLMVK